MALINFCSRLHNWWLILFYYYYFVTSYIYSQEPVRAKKNKKINCCFDFNFNFSIIFYQKSFLHSSVCFPIYFLMLFLGFRVFFLFFSYYFILTLFFGLCAFVNIWSKSFPHSDRWSFCVIFNKNVLHTYFIDLPTSAPQKSSNFPKKNVFTHTDCLFHKLYDFSSEKTNKLLHKNVMYKWVLFIIEFSIEPITML